MALNCVKRLIRSPKAFMKAFHSQEFEHFRASFDIVDS